MATMNVTSDLPHTAAETSPLLVSLPSLALDSLNRILANLAHAFPGQSILAASPEASSEAFAGSVKLVGYTPTAPSNSAWTLTAADFLNAYELAQQHRAPALLLLGAEAQSLEPGALTRLGEAVLSGRADLAVPRYALPARSGLVNSAILYPVTRALFGARPRFPLAIDLGLSLRMAERLAITAQKFTSINQLEAILWPISEAAVAGFTITEIEAGPRSQPQPAAPDLNTLLAQVAGSLFAEVDAKAAFWQRSRIAASSPPLHGTSPAFSVDEIQPMLDSFRLAYGNLHEIWSLVLPPHSLLGLKRLSIMPSSSFSMPDSLWARIVYDFLLAYRLRTINRGHLLGALTPLYLAWVASHILLTAAGTDPEQHVEALAAAFEADKPYLVSRWRWPDRFNP